MKRTGKNPLENSALFQEVEIDVEKERKELNIEPTIARKSSRREDLIRSKGVQQGLPPELSRTTIILNVDLIKKMKDYAYTERIPLRIAYERAITEFLKDKTELLDHEEQAKQ